MMERSKRMLVVLAVAGVLAVVGVGFIWPRLQPHQFHGMALQAADPVADFTLTAHTGEPAQMSDFRGKYVVIYFGYTFCPDVCPLTLAQIGLALRQLGDKAERVQVIMVSVDPERDTAERLAQYMPAFHTSFLGLTGTVDEIRTAALPFGVYFEKQEVGGVAGYLVDHTASVMVLDDRGRMRLIWPFEMPGDLMAADLAYLLR